MCICWQLEGILQATVAEPAGTAISRDFCTLLAHQEPQHSHTHVTYAETLLLSCHSMTCTGDNIATLNNCNFFAQTTAGTSVCRFVRHCHVTNALEAR